MSPHGSSCPGCGERPIILDGNTWSYCHDCDPAPSGRVAGELLAGQERLLATRYQRVYPWLR